MVEKNENTETETDILEARNDSRADEIDRTMEAALLEAGRFYSLEGFSPEMVFSDGRKLRKDI